MLSTQHVQTIEDHWETIVSEVIREVRRDPKLPRLRSLPEAELYEWGQGILKNLGHWLMVSKEEAVAARFERNGKLRFAEAVPLHESVRALCLLKDRMLDYIRNQGLTPDILEIYAEEELALRVGRFFDCMLYHSVRGYESALREAAHMVAA